MDLRTARDFVPRFYAGTTPLLISSRLGFQKVVRVLIEAGADVNKAKMKGGAFPLYLAAQQGHADCLHSILKAGGDYNMVISRTKVNALWIAAQNGRSDFYRRFASSSRSPASTRSSVQLSLMFSSSVSFWYLRPRKVYSSSRQSWDRCQLYFAEEQIDCVVDRVAASTS